MGRRQGPTYARSWIAGLLALFAAGCSSNSIVGVSTGGPPPVSGGSVSVYGTSSFGALFAIGFLAGATSGGGAFYREPELNPDRRVIEQDCSKPIEDPSANLRCR